MSTWKGQQKSLIAQVKSQLNGNWRRLFLEKPRPRLDGVYISQNSYIRNGTKEGGYDFPVYKVRYWRYLRFFSDGTCVLCCTPKPPKELVPTLVRNRLPMRGKDILDYGTYNVMDETLISESNIFIQSTKDNERDRAFPTQYCYILRLGNSYNGIYE